MATPAEIIADSECSVCLGISLFESMQITLLKQILTGAGTTMTQDEINAESGCFTCFGMTLGQANVLVLLNAISDAFGGGGGGGGGLNVAPGVVNPEGVVTANAGATYWNSANQTFWEKQSGSGNTGWVQLI
jgi:hypothetical protein